MNTTPQPTPTNNKRCLSARALFAPLIIPLLLVLPIALSSCDDKEEEEETHHFVRLPKKPVMCDTCLPPATTGGKNTFGCRINGKVWKPKEGWFSPAIVFFYTNGLIDLIANNDVTSEGVVLNLKYITDTGLFVFPNSQLELSRARYNNISNTINFYAEPIIKGSFRMLRMDHIIGIYSGTFEFDAYNANGDTVHITDGRFDIKK